MENLRRYRWIILGMAIGVLLLPTYYVLAEPVIAQTVSMPDMSWLAQLSEGLAVLVILAVILFLVLRYLNDSKKIADPKDPSKTTTIPELMAVSVINFGQVLMEHNHQSELINQTLAAFKDELVQGRGNQMSAIIAVSDLLTDKLQKMEGSRTILTENLERVNGGIGHLQMGQTKMQQDLGGLLEETKKLSKAIVDILNRLENVDAVVKTVDVVVKKVDQTVGDVSASTLTIKDEIRELKTLFHSVDERLNRISIAAGAFQGPSDKLAQPDKPAPQEKDNPDAN